MTIRHLFGRTITFRYVPAVNGEEHLAHELVSARIYAERPSAEQIADVDQLSAGHIGDRVESWDLVNREGTGPAEYEIVFPAIADPDPVGGEDYERYYVALNFKAQAGDVSISACLPCAIYRERGYASKIRVTAQSVWDLESSLEELDRHKPLDTEAKIEAAMEEVVATLEARGFPKDQIFEWEKLSPTVRRKACALFCYDLARGGNQFWFTKGEQWEARADRMLDGAKFGFDADDDGDPDPEAKPQGGAVAFVR